MDHDDEGGSPFMAEAWALSFLGIGIVHADGTLGGPMCYDGYKYFAYPGPCCTIAPGFAIMHA